MNNDMLQAISSMLDKKIDALEERIEKKLDVISVQVNENTQILKALEHNSQVNKSEHDKIINDISHMKGDIKALRQDITKVEIVTASNWSEIAKLKSLQ